MRHTELLILSASVLCSCSDNAPKLRAASAHVVNGATTLAPDAVLTLVQRDQQAATLPPPTEHWTISPDKVTVTFLDLVLGGPDRVGEHVSSLTGCEVTYDRSQPSLAALLDCPFSVDAGTYTHMRLEFSKTFKVLVNDPANSIFTDPASPTGFSSVAPAGGAQVIDYVLTCTSQPCDATKGNSELSFPQPLVVGDDPVRLTVVLHGLHTIVIDRQSGTFLPRLRGLPPVFLMPSVTGVAKADFYSSSGIARNVNISGGPTSPPYVDFFVFYDKDGPTLLGYTNRIASPTSSMISCLQLNDSTFGSGFVQNAGPLSPWLGNPNQRPAGYLGRDASGTLGWATQNEQTKVYVALWSMPEVTTPGGTTTLKCLATSNPPAPVSGNTYSSGVPAIPSPTATVTMRLVAR